MSINKAFEDIKSGISDLIENAIKAFADDAKSDFSDFLADSEDDLRRYAELLANGSIQRIEFDFLVGSKASNAKMLALSAKGIAKARIKHLRDSLRDLIINSVVAAI